MGRTTTPKYRLEMPGTTHSAWNVKSKYGIPGYGSPNIENLQKYIEDYIQSLKIGGSNYHIAKSLGYIPYPNWVRIVRQSDGFVMVRWLAPAFEITG